MPITSKREPLLQGPPKAAPSVNPDAVLDSWKVFRARYFATLTKASGGNWRKSVKQFERLCKPDRLSDLSENTLHRFKTALISEGVDLYQIRWLLTNVRGALKWGFDQRLIDPQNFYVQKCRSGGWRWRMPKGLALRH